MVAIVALFALIQTTVQSVSAIRALLLIFKKVNIISHTYLFRFRVIVKFLTSRCSMIIIIVFCFLTAGCDDCQTILVELKNGALINQIVIQGVYQTSQCINGRKSWISSSTAIWYVPQYQVWFIGPLDAIGTTISGMVSVGYQDDLNCPYNIPNGNWEYYDGRSWILPEDVNDISIGCFQGNIVIK